MQGLEHLKHSIQGAPAPATSSCWDSPPHHKPDTKGRAAAGETKPVPRWLEMEAVTLLFPFPRFALSALTTMGPSGLVSPSNPSKAGFWGITSQRHSLQHHRHCPSHTPWHMTAFSVYGEEAEAHGDGVKPLGTGFFKMTSPGIYLVPRTGDLFLFVLQPAPWLISNLMLQKFHSLTSRALHKVSQSLSCWRLQGQ